MATRRPRYTTSSAKRATSADKHHAYSAAPGLALVMASQGVTLEALSELTGYPQDFLRRMRDEDQTAARVVTSKIAAVLGVEHTVIRGEIPGEVARIRDVIVPGE